MAFSWFSGVLSLGLPMWQELSNHRENIDVERIHHAQQMSHDTEIARRESIRDIWAQKNSKLQTLMIIDTLMFGCVFSFICQGQLPIGTSQELCIMYSISLSLSVATLFFSIWFALRVLSRMTKYNLLDTKQRYVCGKQHGTFVSYYNCHCSKLGKAAMVFFYSGTVLLIITAVVYMWASFVILYESLESAIIFTIISSITIFFMIIVMRCVPSSTRIYLQTDENNELEDPDNLIELDE